MSAATSSGSGSAFAAVVRAEFIKLRRMPIVAATVLLLIGANLLALVLARQESAALLAEEIRVNGFYVLAMGGRCAFGPFALLLVVAATQSLAGEQERGQLRMTMVRPVSRAAFFGGRLAVYVLVAFAVAALDLLIGLAFGAPLGFADVADVAVQGDRYGAAAMTTHTLLAYGLGALALAGTAAIALAISSFCAQATTAVTAGLVIGFLFVAVGFVFGERAERFLLPNYVMREFHELVQLTTGVSVYRDAGATARGILVPLTWLVGGWLLGWRAFERKEIRG